MASDNSFDYFDEHGNYILQPATDWFRQANQNAKEKTAEKPERLSKNRLLVPIKSNFIRHGTKLLIYINLYNTNKNILNNLVSGLYQN
jgi:hypothetical protein